MLWPFWISKRSGDKGDTGSLTGRTDLHTDCGADNPFATPGGQDSRHFLDPGLVKLSARAQHRTENTAQTRSAIFGWC